MSSESINREALAHVASYEPCKRADQGRRTRSENYYPCTAASALLPHIFCSAKMDSWEQIASALPVTVPFPRPDNVEGLWTDEQLETIDELVRNPDQTVRWRMHLNEVVERADQAERASRGQASDLELAVLGDKLSTAETRLNYQRIVDAFERALQASPRSYKLWKDYLQLRSTYVLGTASKPLKLNAPKKKRGEGGMGRSMTEWLEAGKNDYDELDDGERDMESDWSSGLDPVAGWQEWRALAATFERALMWLPNVRLSSSSQCNQD